MTHLIDSSPLGQKTAYISQYDANLLFPIPRSEARKALRINESMPFYGVDIWTGYELSWLNAKGKPVVAVAEFSFPCNSPFIVESKSFKLYLNSFNQTRLSEWDEVEKLLINDLSAVAGALVTVRLCGLKSNLLLNNTFLDATSDVICIDELDIAIEHYHPEPKLLHADKTILVNEHLCSHLLKSNCPVTGQPDWATVFINYSGAKISRESLLQYVISFREHQDFHEHCVERIFVDLLENCKPDHLSVYARYTRRGGLDINPFRSTEKNTKPTIGRLLRQ